MFVISVVHTYQHDAAGAHAVQEDQPWEFLHLFTEIKSALEAEREAKVHSLIYIFKCSLFYVC